MRGNVIMKNYQLLSTFKYGSNGHSSLSEEELNAEYLHRINDYSASVTAMFPRLVNKESLEMGILNGKSVAKVNDPIFWMVTPKILMLLDTVRKQSAEISALIYSNKIPTVAINSYTYSMLTNEIFFSNEIEGVHTNPEEISTIVWDTDTKVDNKHRRLESTIRQYKASLQANQRQINNLSDFRQIYDQLLEGEISKDSLPDVNIIRDSFVYIGRQNNTVHLPPDNEQDISLALSQLITFMNNDDDVIPIVKAIVTHFMFENTHPFRDGNGRMGRYLLSSYLSNKLDVFTGLSISTSIHTHVQNYYRLFRDAGNSENRAELTLFIEGMLEIIADGQTEVLNQFSLRMQTLQNGLEKLKQKLPDMNDDESNILYIFLQSKLFTSSGTTDGITDNELGEFIKENSNISRRKFKDIVKKYTGNGVLKTIKRKPLQHILNSEYIN